MSNVDPELGLQAQKGAAFTTEDAIQGLKKLPKATDAAKQRQLWEKVEARFQQFAAPDGTLHRNHFPECIGMKDSKEFANALFDALVRRKGLGNAESINKEHLYEHYMSITDKSFDSRIQIFFDLCDKDSDGRLTGEEVKQVILLSASANKLSKMKEKASEYADLIMEELDVDHNGSIELSELEAFMRGTMQRFAKEAGEVHEGDHDSEATPPPAKKTRAQRYVKKTRHFVLNNWKRLWILALWAGAMAGLFAWKFLQYKHRDAFHVMGYCLCVAKGAAETLKLNFALILFPVCRNTLTWLRSTWLGKLIPFDDNLEFHKIIAAAVAVGAFVHTICHLTCDIPKLVNAPNVEFELYLGSEFDHQPSYAEIARKPVALTGIFMVVIMIIAMTLALHWFRRSTVKLPSPLNRLYGFNAFWYSHHMFAIVYVLLIVHSILLLFHKPWYEKTTWMYIAIPLVLYIGERFVRIYRFIGMEVDVVKASVYTGNVLAIHMTKPKGFEYKSGMYLFLQCPKISPFEWHPFSITSAPGDDTLSVHIRTLGDWTAAMRKVFSEALDEWEKIGNKDKRSGELTPNPGFPRLYVDGPYGAPAQDYLEYDVLLLIGLGIGATPFISILKDMLHHSMQESGPSLGPDLGSAGSLSSNTSMKPKTDPKAYFYWVTREQASFDWFRGVMRDVEEIDNNRSIEMHSYLTSVYEEGDTRSHLVMMLQALHHAKSGVDVVSGTRARTHFARPNWKSVFSRLAATHPNKRIGVFYCGPVTLATQLETLTKTYTMNSSSEFEFHKENF